MCAHAQPTLQATLHMARYLLCQEASQRRKGHKHDACQRNDHKPPAKSSDVRVTPRSGGHRRHPRTATQLLQAQAMQNERCRQHSQRSCSSSSRALAAAVVQARPASASRRKKHTCDASKRYRGKPAWRVAYATQEKHQCPLHPNQISSLCTARRSGTAQTPSSSRTTRGRCSGPGGWPPEH